MPLDVRRRSPSADVDLNPDVIDFDSDDVQGSWRDLQTGERQELRPSTRRSRIRHRSAFQPDMGYPGRGKASPERSPAQARTTNRCFIRNQLQSGVSSFGGQWRFTPAAGALIVNQDSDWLSAGVWLTIPDDVENGDYAAAPSCRATTRSASMIAEVFQAGDNLNAVIGHGATMRVDAYGRYAEERRRSHEERSVHRGCRIECGLRRR